MKILKIDNVKVDYERGGSGMEETMSILTSKKDVFRTFSETAKYYILPEEGIDFDGVVNWIYSNELIRKVTRGDE